MSVQFFHELHVVSDLHLGGKPGFQIFCQGDILANFIKSLTEPSDRRIGLVLNGDIVDFLAEEPARYLDPQEAVTKLERIFYQDKAFSGVWLALQEFVAQPNRQLILILGNHDVELALPHVTEWLYEKLSNNNPEARGRLTTCFDGSGFACTVGSKRVFCIHGNHVDVWNMIDHRQLLEVAIAINSDQTPEEWDPNAGTRMVIDVMNSIKHDYPIVDLLKPEVEAVVPMLLALDPGRVSQITKILKVVKYLSRDYARKALGFLSAEQELEASPISDEEVMSEFLSDRFDYRQPEGAMTSESLIRDAFEAMDAGTDPKFATAADEGFLGPLDYIPALFSSKSKKIEKLCTALQKNLAQDQTFDITFKDDTFEKIDQQMGQNVDYLITGHTHLERAIQRSTSGCYYFNSGTWIRLIRLQEDIINDKDVFARVFSAFKKGTMQELDAIIDLGPLKNQPLVMLKPTVVAIVEQDGSTFGELRHINPANGIPEPVANTRLPRS
jgi:UDP-2,3-diacylglucosamine pyrophosphatase LpxH